MPKSSDVFATEGLIIRSRCAIRRRRTSFNSLAMPFNNIPRTTPFGPLYQTRVNTKRRATRSRRTLFSSFIIPIEREMHVESLHSPINHNERRRARQVIDTARRRKARAARTIEQRANDLAIDNARRKRFCEGQTSEQRSKVRASNTTRKQRSRYRYTDEQRANERALNTIRQRQVRSGQTNDQRSVAISLNNARRTSITIEENTLNQPSTVSTA
ncbi:Uncharacterized protein Adt_34091 [Abeliophyllum distichum]|uniref:Uncharacterized protein n=1 Tax=Abeliophyllum distichum TaxID=126358 RepID=A0ABD1QY55_9LAMI